ncbi:hypothetical protein AJ88_03075 [Mesorhizobium amorphae CCBAU 01583]|nr:hypothetical protein AJ88_03075 [Mesorhizobium amorphae CCBAU 01583]
MPDPTVLLSPSDPAWDEWLGRAPHDFYHRAAYHAFAERMGEGRAWMVVHGTPERFMAWPYVASFEDGRTDANSVYGYTGPVGLGLDDTSFGRGHGRKSALPGRIRSSLRCSRGFIRCCRTGATARASTATN